MNDGMLPEDFSCKELRDAVKKMYMRLEFIDRIPFSNMVQSLIEERRKAIVRIHKLEDAQRVLTALEAEDQAAG